MAQILGMYDEDKDGARIRGKAFQCERGVDRILTLLKIATAIYQEKKRDLPPLAALVDRLYKCSASSVNYRQIKGISRASVLYDRLAHSDAAIRVRSLLMSDRCVARLPTSFPMQASPQIFWRTRHLKYTSIWNQTDQQLILSAT